MHPVIPIISGIMQMFPVVKGSPKQILDFGTGSISRRHPTYIRQCPYPFDINARTGRRGAPSNFRPALLGARSSSGYSIASDPGPPPETMVGTGSPTVVRAPVAKSIENTEIVPASPLVT